MPSLETVTVKYTKQQFIDYLESSVIPDLKIANKHMTALDFEAAVLFIKGSQTVGINLIENTAANCDDWGDDCDMGDTE